MSSFQRTSGTSPPSWMCDRPLCPSLSLPALSLNTPLFLHKQINYTLIQAFPKTDPAAIILRRPGPYFKRANDHFEHFLSLFQLHLMFACDATASKSRFS